jgi:flagellar hook-associated protein 3 FlgL
MSIDRVGTNAQAQYLLAEIMQRTQALNASQQQIASGKVSTTYAGLGNKAQALEAARASAARADAYQAATQAALNQVNLQDTELTQLSGIAQQLQAAISTAVGNNDATGLMQQVQNIFDQASQVLNAKDPSGNYLFGGDRDNAPPFTAASLSDLAGLPDVSDAFSNGTQKKSVMVADGQSVQIGVLASDIGTQLMQTLKDVASFAAGPNGNFGTQLTTAQSDFLSGEISVAQTAAHGLNDATGANGFTNNQLTDASDHQQALSALYTGFVSNIENVDMPTAISQLNQDQTALQAALQVTAQLGKISLLNYLPVN